MGQSIAFRCPDGSTCDGYLAEAANAAAGIVVLQEWWGLNDQIRGTAERFAAAGIETRYYTPAVHKAAFALPPYIQDMIG